MNCKLCLDEGQEVPATRLVQRAIKDSTQKRTVPMCTRHAAANWKPSGLLTARITVPGEFYGDEISERIEQSSQDRRSSIPVRLCACNCGQPLPSLGHNTYLPGHLKALRAREAAHLQEAV